MTWDDRGTARQRALEREARRLGVMLPAGPLEGHQLPLFDLPAPVMRCALCDGDHWYWQCHPVPIRSPSLENSYRAGRPR